MPIVKDGNGVIGYTEKRDRWDSDVTGVFADIDFAISDDLDPTKQLKFSVANQTANKSITLEAGGNTTDITLTLPSTSGSLGGGGGVNSFTTIQPITGTSPVATSGSDTLTFTSSDGSMQIIGDSGTDTIDFKSVSSGGVSDGDKGDIVVSGSGTVWTIDNNVVTNAKAAQVATQTFKGRTTAATGNVEDLTATQATAMLNLFSTSTKGLAPGPTSAEVTKKFPLNADGTYNSTVGANTIQSELGVGMTITSQQPITISPSTVSEIEDLTISAAFGAARVECINGDLELIAKSSTGVILTDNMLLLAQLASFPAGYAGFSNLYSKASDGGLYYLPFGVAEQRILTEAQVAARSIYGV